MQVNFLEEIVAEWYEYTGYIIRRNDRVGKRKEGGHEGELDVIAFNPQTQHLVHIETSMDSSSWPYRENRFKKKFDIGSRYIKSLFNGLDLPNNIEKIVILAIGSRNTHKEIGMGRIIFIEQFISTILKELRDISYLKRIVPEKYPILRTLQIIGNHKKLFIDTLLQ
jgi:hypothetical protein